jgi:hypothetical protein
VVLDDGPTAASGGGEPGDGPVGYELRVTVRMTVEDTMDESSKGRGPVSGGVRPVLTVAAPARGRLTRRPTFGQALRRAMAADSRQVAEVALLLGTSRANIELWCDDLLDPWPENFDALTEYLGIDMDELGSLVIRSQVHRVAGEAGASRYGTGHRIAN